MNDPLNFFLTPQQQAEVRRDQYFPMAPPITGGSSWTNGHVDYRGNYMPMSPMDSQVLVRVASIDGSIYDSNGLYCCYKIDQWFGVSGTDLLCEMRLDSQEDLEAGDEVFGLISKVVANSPDDADDGFIIVKEIIVVPTPFFLAKITSVGYACGSSTINSASWVKQQVGTCGVLSDDTSMSGTLGSQPIITVVSTGDGVSVNQVWSFSFSSVPTSGTFTICIDMGCHTFTVSTVTAAIIDAAFGNTSTTGTLAGGFVVTYTGDFLGHTLTWGGSTGTPFLANLPASEINSNYTFSVPAIVMMFPGGGGRGTIVLKKTQSGDGLTVGTIWTAQANSHVTGGTFKVILDHGSPSSALPYNVSSAALQAAIPGSTVTGSSLAAGYTITMSGISDHSLDVDGSGLLDDRSFEFLAPAPKLTTVQMITGITCVDGAFVLTTTPTKVVA